MNFRNLPDLTTIDEVALRIGRDLTLAEQEKAAAFIRDASASVRRYTGQWFTQVVDDIVTLRVSSTGKVRLPQRPITAVTAVTFITIDQQLTPTFFRWYGLETVDVYPNVIDPFGWYALRTDVGAVNVTYTHGYPPDEMPHDLSGIVAQIVGRALGTSLLDTGKTAESIAGYSYQTGAAAAAGGFGLLPAEKELLDDFTRTVGMAYIGP